MYKYGYGRGLSGCPLNLGYIRFDSQRERDQYIAGYKAGSAARYELAMQGG